MRAAINSHTRSTNSTELITRGHSYHSCRVPLDLCLNSEGDLLRREIRPKLRHLNRATTVRVCFLKKFQRSRFQLRCLGRFNVLRIGEVSTLHLTDRRCLALSICRQPINLNATAIYCRCIRYHVFWVRYGYGSFQ